MRRKNCGMYEERYTELAGVVPRTSTKYMPLGSRIAQLLVGSCTRDRQNCTSQRRCLYALQDPASPTNHTTQNQQITPRSHPKQTVDCYEKKKWLCLCLYLTICVCISLSVSASHCLCRHLTICCRLAVAVRCAPRGLAQASRASRAP